MLEAWQSDRPEKSDWRKLVEHAQTAAEIQHEYRPVDTRATRRIISDKPILVANIADFHLGSPHTDHQAFLNTTDFLIEHGFYLNVVGPDMETAFAWFRSAEVVLNQTLPPWLQIELYRQWLDEMLPRTLAVCADNHSDMRLERYLGDIGLVWREEIPYFRAEGILTVEVGPDEDHLAKYEIVMSHKYSGKSIYHDLQPALRMMRDIYPIADAYITAHTHHPAYMNGVFYEEARAMKPRQHFMVCGKFKTGGDLYSLRNFGGSGVLGVPVLMLWPNEYRIQYFDSPEIAAEVLGL